MAVGVPSDAGDARRGPGFAGKYVSVTTFRRSGEPVATPVWFAEFNGHLFVDTDGESGKARRIRNNPHVLVAPCSASGKLKASKRPATVEVIESGEMPMKVRELYTRKYRVDRIITLPVYRLMQVFKRGGGGGKQPVVLVITPQET